MSLVEGASRVLDLSGAAFARRRIRSVQELRRAADQLVAPTLTTATEPPTEEISTHTLFVGSLPYAVTKDDLREFFAAFGEVIDAVVVLDRDSGRSKGFGYVKMSYIRLPDNLEIGGFAISVGEARTRSERPQRRIDKNIPTPEPASEEETQPTSEFNVKDFERMLGSPITVEIVLPGTEKAEEAERVLSGVGG